MSSEALQTNANDKITVYSRRRAEDLQLHPPPAAPKANSNFVYCIYQAHKRVATVEQQSPCTKMNLIKQPVNATVNLLRRRRRAEMPHFIKYLT